MGVDGFTTLIRDYAPDAFCTIPVRQLRGLRIAIDACRWAFAAYAMILKNSIESTQLPQFRPNPDVLRDILCQRALSYARGWLNRGIMPVFVFDGRARPEKKRVIVERAAKREACEIRIAAGQQNLYNNPPGSPGYGAALEELQKALRSHVNLRPDDIDLLMVVLQGVGLPVLRAIHDAEELCAMLCVEKQVTAALTTDGDALVFGCPLVIKGYNAQNNELLDCIRLDKILYSMKITMAVFVDICILLGTDFGEHTKGMSAAKCRNLIVNNVYADLDALTDKVDLRPCNHLAARRIFGYAPSHTMAVNLVDPPRWHDLPADVPPLHTPDMLNVNVEALPRAASYFQLINWTNEEYLRFAGVYHNLPECTAGWPAELGLAAFTGPHTCYVERPRHTDVSVINAQLAAINTSPTTWGSGLAPQTEVDQLPTKEQAPDWTHAPAPANSQSTAAAAWPGNN